MNRLFSRLLGISEPPSAPSDDRDRHREEHHAAMRAVHMKVDAMKVGVARMESERRQTEQAARLLLSRLQEDFPR